jgi:hypothetical protein
VNASRVVQGERLGTFWLQNVRDRPAPLVKTAVAPGRNAKLIILEPPWGRLAERKILDSRLLYESSERVCRVKVGTKKRKKSSRQARSNPLKFPEL